MRCIVSCGNTPFPWLVFFFGALLWGSKTHKHTGRWMWQGSASVVSWKWDEYSCHSKLDSTLSVLLLSVIVSQAWNPHQLELSPGTWSLWLSQASVHLLWSLCWCHRCCLSSAWSSRHLFPCRRLCRLCREAKLILQVLPLLKSHRCRQQSGYRWLFCLQCWQCLQDLLRCLSWPSPEICWRGRVRVDIPVGLQLLFGTNLICCHWRGWHLRPCYRGFWWLGPSCMTDTAAKWSCLWLRSWDLGITFDWVVWIIIL